MGTPAVMPMIGPDGTAALIPQANLQAAANAGAKPAIKLYGPDGSPAYVPLEKMADAVKAGAMTEGQYQQNISPASDPNKPGWISSPLRMLEGVGNAIGSGVSGVYHAITDEPSPDASAYEKMNPAAYRLLVKPQLDAGKRALEGAKQIASTPLSQQNPETISRTIGHGLATLIPGIGPMIDNTADAMLPQIDKGNYAGALGTAVGTAGMAYLGGKAGGALSRAISPEPLVAGQNYAPSHASAFEGLTAKANGMGPNFIPQNLTPDALSPIRQSVADMIASPNLVDQEIAKAATSKGAAPVDRLGALHTIIQRGLTDLESQHTPVLAQVAQTPVDMTPIQRGLQAQIKPGMSAADIAGIQDLIHRSGQITNIGDLNSFRQIMNEEASPSYRQTPTRAGQASAPQQVATDTANAVRSHYFEQMQQATGTDFRPLKNQESQLLTTKEAIERMLSPEAKAEAKFNAPTTPRAKAGEFVDAVANIVKNPKKLVQQQILRESPVADTANLIRKALTNLPEPTPATPQASAPIPSNAPQLPASASPTMVQGTPVTPQTPPLMLGNPQGALSSPALQQLLQRGSQDLQLPADTSGIQVAQSPRTAYPPLNEATARTRVQPTRFQQTQAVSSTGPIPVTPQGQAMTPIQRFLQAGDLSPTIENPTSEQLKQAIAQMRKRKGK